MPVEDAPPTGRPYFVFTIYGHGAEEQSEWCTKEQAFTMFRKSVQPYLTHSVDDDARAEIGVYDASIEATIASFIYNRNGTR